MRYSTKFKIVLLAILTCYFSHAQWAPMASLTGASRQGAAGFTIGNKAYIIGGQASNFQTTFDDVWEYDVVSNTWAQKLNFPGSFRVGGVAFTINGKGYFGFGEDGLGNYYDDIWEYNPVLDTWTQKASLPSSARTNAVGFTIGNKAYVGLGIVCTITQIGQVCGKMNDFWEYNPISDTWTQKANFPGNPREYSIGVGLNGKGYVGLGVDSTSTPDFTDFYEYNPITNTWATKANITGIGASDAEAFVLNNEIYVLGGINFNSFTVLNSCKKYNPLTNTWTNSTNFNGGAITAHVALSFPNFILTGTGFDANINTRNDWWKLTASTTDISEDLINFNQVQMYPNPSKDILNIKLTKEMDESVLKLYSADGKLVLDKMMSSSETAINISSLPNGMYILEIKSENIIVRKKLLKN